MANTNAPILNLILRELKDIKTDIFEIKGDMRKFKEEMYLFKDDMTKFKGEIGEFKNKMNNFHDNMEFQNKQASKSQEKENAEFLRGYINAHIPSLNTEVWQFGDFYDVAGNKITDIDGCITANTIPLIPTIGPGLKNNSTQIKNIRNSIFFIESKKLLDKPKFDTKMIQYSKILSLITNMNKGNMYNKSSEIFKRMFSSYPLKYKPSEIYFIMSGNDISLPMRSFIQSINENTLTEDIYKSYVYKMFMEHTIHKRIENEINDKPTLLKKYNAIKNYDEFIKFFQNPIFIEHSVFLNNFFMDYNRMKQIYLNLKGMIGYIYHDTLYMT